MRNETHRENNKNGWEKTVQVNLKTKGQQIKQFENKNTTRSWFSEYLKDVTCSKIVTPTPFPLSSRPTAFHLLPQDPTPSDPSQELPL